VGVAVLVRPGFEALYLPGKPLDLGQQVVEALLCGGELGVSFGMKNKLRQTQEATIEEGL
jgi:hypothetical protein